MPRLHLRAGILAAAFAVVAGCGTPTEIVVVVDTDLAVPEAIDTVEVRVEREGEEPRVASRVLEVDGPAQPTTVVVEHRSGSRSAVSFTATGRKDGVAVIRARARTNFVEGERLMLELPLLAQCFGIDCAEDQRCGIEGCEPVVQPALPEWTGTVPRIAPDDSCDPPCTDGICRRGACCDGCWNGESCEPGSSVSACGSGGALCAPCVCPSAVCSGRTCNEVSDFAQVTVGRHRACALTEDGRAFCWGQNREGHAGVGHLDPVLRPEMVATEQRFRTISAGGTITCAVDVDGALWCWGQLPDAFNRSVPGLVDDTREWVAIAAGLDFACGLARTDAGASTRLFCFGAPEGALALDGGTSLQPAEAVTDVDDWAAVVANDQNACAIRMNRELHCWGDVADCRLGVFATDGGPDGGRPTLVMGDVVDVALSSAGTACAVREVGDAATVWCWGPNPDGSAGVPAAERPVVCPPARVEGSEGIRAVALGGMGVAIEEGSALLTWPPHPPARLDDLTGFAAVSGYRDSRCALRTNGSLFCWGANDVGQLGIGSNTDAPDPSLVCRPN